MDLPDTLKGQKVVRGPRRLQLRENLPQGEPHCHVYSSLLGDVAEGLFEFILFQNFIRKSHQFQHQAVLLRLDSRQMLSLLDDDFGDADFSGSANESRSRT